MSSSSTTDRRPIGFQVTLTYCRDCAPEGVRDNYHPMRVGDDHGIPYRCDLCGEQLLPCDHTFDEWRPAFEGGEIRFCTRECGASERRP